MIRIEVDEAELRRKVEEHKPGWLRRAEKTRDHNRVAGSFRRKTPNWSEIKSVYVRLQNGKCAYCERQLTLEECGAAEWDVEHFRPKKAVQAWPSAELRNDRGITYELPHSTVSKKGYYLIAHHPFNYVAACKSCNSGLKGSYFPVAAPRIPEGDDPRVLNQREKPYLIYPLGDCDDDPEKLLSFHGVSPKAIAPDIEGRLRAVVTVDLFDLDLRETLIRQRAQQINHLWLALTMIRIGPTQEDRDLALSQVMALTSSREPHTNCARAYKGIYDRDQDRALEIYRNAAEIYTRDPGGEDTA